MVKRNESRRTNDAYEHELNKYKYHTVFEKNEMKMLGEKLGGNIGSRKRTSPMQIVSGPVRFRLRLGRSVYGIAPARVDRLLEERLLVTEVF